jgi:hypothetical protein
MYRCSSDFSVDGRAVYEQYSITSSIGAPFWLKALEVAVDPDLGVEASSALGRHYNHGYEHAEADYATNSAPQPTWPWLILRNLLRVLGQACERQL